MFVEGGTLFSPSSLSAHRLAGTSHHVYDMTKHGMHAAKAQAQFLCSGGFVSRGEACSSSDDHDQFSFVSTWREPHEHILRGRMLFLLLLYRFEPWKGTHALPCMMGVAFCTCRHRAQSNVRELYLPAAPSAPQTCCSASAVYQLSPASGKLRKRCVTPPEDLKPFA
jgi:hypothetical protein